MAIEYEWKFRTSEAVQAAIAQALTGPRQQFAMQTTYYDTPTGALSSLRYTLRQRLENNLSVCTLKTPAQEGRREWEVVSDEIQAAIPLLIAAGAPKELARLTQDGLLPICGARFTRTAITVDLPEGTVEVALDRGVLLGGGREVPLWEAEVELKDGAPAVCDRFARELADRFALIPEMKSKFARARALYQGE